VSNPGDTDWFDLAGLEFGLDTPALAAIGQRSDRFIALWVWHRTGLYSMENAPVPARGTLIVDDVPAGEWTVTWWDTRKGAPAGPAGKISHPGGALRLPTPPIARHAAVVLIR